jgi:hypothetical protein
MAEKIKVIIKEPGKAPEIKTITNDLGTLQSIVGGYIETVTLASDFVIICNEDGKLWNLPYNFDFGGQSFVGTVVFVGVDGDKFADVPERLASFMPGGYHEGAVTSVSEICPNEHCVFLVQTGGEKPLCPFRHCLKPEIEKHDKTREEAVK